MTKFIITTQPLRGDDGTLETASYAGMTKQTGMTRLHLPSKSCNNC